jgi:hypothetical protein
MSVNVNDISALTGGAENFDADSFIDSTFLLGDEAGGLTAVAVHSQTLKAMVKADLIDFLPDSQGKLTIPTYLGKTVIVDDGMPVASNPCTPRTSSARARSATARSRRRCRSRSSVVLSSAWARSTS